MKKMPSDPARAVALYYDGEKPPVVSATGSDEVAEQIIAIAREHGVPLYENAQLVDLLAQLDLGEAIPETLYLVIAEIIAFAYHLQGKHPRRSTSKNLKTKC